MRPIHCLNLKTVEIKRLDSLGLKPFVRLMLIDHLNRQALVFYWTIAPNFLVSIYGQLSEPI